MMITPPTSSRREAEQGVLHANEFCRLIDESVRADGTNDMSVFANQDAGGVLY